MKKVVLLVLVLSLVMTGFAWAGTDKGYKELGIDAALQRTTNSLDDDVNNNTTVGLIFNYYFTPFFSIGGTYRINLSRYEPEDGDATETTFQTLNLRADLLAGGPTKTVIPYIGLHGGNTSIYSESGGETFDSSSFSYGLQGGLKMFPSERVSVNLELDYTTTEPDVDVGESYTIDTLSLFVGASFYF
jgi:opacity protein-like surface antigen